MNWITETKKRIEAMYDDSGNPEKARMRQRLEAARVSLDLARRLMPPDEYAQYVARRDRRETDNVPQEQRKDQ